MRFAKLLAVILISSPVALGQFLTQVSGTVKDPTGLPYSNGTIVATLVISGTPRFTFNSLPYTPPSQPVGLDANGSFVMSLADVNQLTPSGGTWSFHVCSAQGTVQPGSPITQGPVCFDAPGFIITGTSVNISTQLSSASARLTTGGAGGSVTVTPGTTGQFLIYASPNTVAGTPTLTTNGTANTSTVPLSFSPFGPLSPTPIAGATTISTASNGGLILSAAGGGYVAFRSIGINGVGIGINNGGNLAFFNFNNTSPAAPTNGRNISWATTSSNISAALVGDGNPSHTFNGDGTFAQSTLSNAGTTCNAATPATTVTCNIFGIPSAFSFIPQCTVTPMVAGITSYFISNVTLGAGNPSTVTITYTPSLAATFNVVCTGTGQP